MAVRLDLMAEIRDRLRGSADPGRAPQMQAYMKSAMPYLGVAVPVVRKLTAVALQPYPLSVADLRDTAAEFWQSAEFREERYAAIGLTRSALARGSLDMLELLREMMVGGAWWDFVDEISHSIGDLLLAHPAVMGETLRRWSTDEVFWLRRSAIIAQLGHKARTDTDLLMAVIEPNLGEREFFIRKAIGWALRDYSRVDPEWVLDFVDRHDSISPLSRREAIRNIGRA